MIEKFNPPIRFGKKNKKHGSILLESGSRIAVIGGGPAGSFFSYFVLSMSKRLDLKISVDIYEPRDFNIPGPQGCNMCGGVLYESLVQSLAVDGINLPADTVQRGIEYNMLHFDEGDAIIHTPLQEKRIAATFRGIGPRGLVEIKGGSLDSYLLKAALDQGAIHIRKRVEDVCWTTSKDAEVGTKKLVEVKSQGGQTQTYDLLVVASGVNTSLLKQFSNLEFGYEPPQTTKLVVREYFLGEEIVSKHYGPVFHAYLLDLPGLDYGAIIPKGDYITICLLSSHQELHKDAIESFLNDPVVKRSLPPDFHPEDPACQCGPRINVNGSKRPFGDRVVFIGDSGVSRLYKDGIGASYRSAKIAAATVVFQGISGADFKKYYLSFCRKLERDNQIGKFIFKVAGLIPKTKLGQRVVLRMIFDEQRRNISSNNSMSMVIWDMLTGGAPYSEIFQRTIQPLFLMRIFWYYLHTLVSPLGGTKNQQDRSSISTGFLSQTSSEEMNMNLRNFLGKTYQDNQIIVKQGEPGECMYVIQEGSVEIIYESDQGEIRLATREKGDFFGEMALFEKEVRSATVRAKGEVRVLTIDKKNFMRRVQEDPSLAFHLVQSMSARIRELSDELTTSLRQQKDYS